MTEKEWRALKKKHHICRECGKQDAYTFGGRSCCAECAAKNAARKRAKRLEQGDDGSHKRWQEKKAAEGLCIYCGKRKAGEGRRICKLCGKKQYERRREKAVRGGMNWPRGANGYCWLCNKRKAIEGKRLCQTCYDRRVAVLTPEAGEKGRETMRRRAQGG